MRIVSEWHFLPCLLQGLVIAPEQQSLQSGSGEAGESTRPRGPASPTTSARDTGTQMPSSSLRFQVSREAEVSHGSHVWCEGTAVLTGRAVKTYTDQSESLCPQTSFCGDAVCESLWLRDVKGGTPFS